MTTVADLQPGDKIALGERTAVFIAKCQHPLYTGLTLVIWRMSDWSWSHDALNISQHVGELIEPLDPVAQKERLRDWLLGGPG